MASKKNKKDYTGTIVSIDDSGEIVRTTPKSSNVKATKVNSNTSNLVSKPTVETKQTVTMPNMTQKQANKNYEEKLSLFNRATQDLDRKRIDELNKNNIDLKNKFQYVDFKDNIKDGVVNKKSLQQREREYEQFEPKLDELTKAEREAQSKARNDLKLAKYQKNVADVDAKEVSTLDQLVSPFWSGVGNYLSTITDDNRYTDENGNTMYLPSENDLWFQKVRNSYGDDLLGKVGQFGTDVSQELGKQAAVSGLNAMTGGKGGSALYFTDIIADQYKQNINEGYDKNTSLANALVKGGSNYIKQKLLGGMGKKLTGETSWLENTLTKKFADLVSNPRIVSMLASMSSEGIDELTDTWVEAGIDSLMLGKDFNPVDVFMDSVYSGLIGAGTGAGNTATGQILQTATNKLTGQNALKNQNIVQNNNNSQNIVNNAPNIEQNTQPNVETTTQTETPQIETKPQENINTQPTIEQQQLDLNEAETSNNKATVETTETTDDSRAEWTKTRDGMIEHMTKVADMFKGDKKLTDSQKLDLINSSLEMAGYDTLKELPSNNNVAERKNDDVITLKNSNLDTKDTNVKQEDTDVSIGGKRVKVEVPTDTHKNNLGQDIPNKIDTAKVKRGDGDSKFYNTITERSAFVKQEVKEKIKNDNYIKHYDTITNEDTLNKALNKLSETGTEAISDFFTTNKELTPEDTALGIILFEQSQQNGDYDMSNRVLRKLRENGTKTGQIMQLYSLFSRMTPDGMYKWAGDQLLKAEEIFEKNKTKKWIEQNRDRWQLNPDEVTYIKSQMEKVQALNNSNDTTTEVSLATYGQKDNGKTIKVSKDRATQLEIAKIQKLIEDKIPPAKGQALKAWMRISMLGNPKTSVTRNPLGNLLIKPVNDVGDVIGTLVDKAISKKTNVRTKGAPQIASSIEGFVRGGKESIQDYKVGVNTREISGNRFEVGQGKSFNEKHTGLLSKQRNAFSKVLNKMDNGVTFVLDFGDRPFYEAAFENSLSNQMELNGIEDVNQAPKWILENAQQEALERTWQDDNEYTKAVLNVRKALNGINVKGYGLGDVLVPFAKTPANLTKAIVDYSPVGVGKALLQGNGLRKSIDNGQFTPQMQHQFVNQLGKAMAGTMLYVLASGLVSAGYVTGKEDDDQDVADFMKNTLGIQPYSIKIGDKSFTYDWAQPVAAPFAIVADLDNLLKTTKEEKDLTFVLKSAISSASSILLEQSFLEGIKDVLGGYGDPIDNLLQEIEGLPARAIPTFLQQIATLVDGKQRMSYGNDGISNIESQAKAKLPVISSELPVKRNTLGQEVERYGGENNVWNVFFNPANYSQGRATESAKEIYRVYQATNDKTILPRTVSNTIKNEDGTKLTNAQKSEFLRISGGIVDDNVKKLKNNKDYQEMSDEDKATVIKKIVDYAYNKAREQVTNHELASEYKKADQAIEAGYALYDYYSTKQSTKQTKTTNSNNSRNRYEEMSAIGIDGKTFDRFKAFVSTARGESSTGGLTKKQKIINWINAQNLTKQQKQNLYNDYVENSKIYSSYN